MAFWQGRRSASNRADKPDRPRGVRGFRSLGLVLLWSNTVKARRCDDIIHACNKRLHKELR